MSERSIRVCDTSFTTIKDKTYDCLILAVGAESRCCHVVKSLYGGNNCKVAQIIVLRYPDVDDREYQKIKKNLSGICHNKPDICEMKLASDSYEGIYDILNERVNRAGRRALSIAIDYSCMSRVWYAALLYWYYLKFRQSDLLCFTFFYAKGQYTNDIATKDVIIKEIRAVPGCVGCSSRQANTAAIFCLGFYGYMSLCVYDELEPNEIYTILTSEKPLREYPIEDQPGNKELIDRSTRSMKISVGSVEGAFRQMMEIAKYRQLKGENVTIVPMGPKPHILASILVALANHDVCVMRVRHDQYTSDVTPAGEIIATEVKFVDINYEDK